MKEHIKNTKIAVIIGSKVMIDKEFEEEIDKMYDQMFQQQHEMEELGLINYCDRAYYIQNPEEYEKDKKICELESEIEKLKTFVDSIDKYEQYDKNAENLVLFNPKNCYLNGHELIIKTDNQDKIGFAVEQLKKVKRLLYPELRFDYSLYLRVIRTINNQIKQLIKEGR